MRPSTLSHLSRFAASTSRPISRPRARDAVPLNFTSSAARSIVTIPSPALDSSKGHTRFMIKTAQRLPSTVHVLSIVRALEARFGPILNIDVPRDADTLSPHSMMWVTTLRPVEFGQAIMLEIPAPTFQRNMFGGPSLDEVVGAVRSAPIVKRGGSTNFDYSRNANNNNSNSRSRRNANANSNMSGTEAANANSVKPSGDTIQFRVEIRTAPDRRPRRDRTARVTPTTREQGEDDAIVRALGEFGAGFYGGFDGVAGRFDGLLRETKEGNQAETEVEGEGKKESVEA